MTAEVSKEEIKFLSADKETQINACIWQDKLNENPTGIVQLVHGMAEHIERYDEFAQFLVSKGFIVCAHDHIGHGKSVKDKKHWGHIPIHQGDRILVSDVHELHRIVKERFGEDLPYFLFGHSMGSFVVRAYITRYGAELSGAIICGTGQLPVFASKAGNKLAHLIAKTKGAHTRSKLLDSMGAGSYGKKVKDAQTDLDWLSYNKDNVQKYIDDERCGFMFSAGGYAALTALTAAVASPEAARKIPKKLPLLYIAGKDDPVGDFGKGVRAACKMAVDAGVEDVSLQLYDGMRHEILNEDNKQTVFDDIDAWLEARL